ncbi:uncharacterized protein LOC144337760 [Macaca mulatta]
MSAAPTRLSSHAGTGRSTAALYGRRRVGCWEIQFIREALGDRTPRRDYKALRASRNCGPTAIQKRRGGRRSDPENSPGGRELEALGAVPERESAKSESERRPEPGKQLRRERSEGRSEAVSAPWRPGPVSAGVEPANERMQGPAGEPARGRSGGGAPSATRRETRRPQPWALGLRGRAGGREDLRGRAGETAAWTGPRRSAAVGSPPAARPCERQRGASRDPGSRRPLQGGARLAVWAVERAFWAHLGVR